MVWAEEAGGDFSLVEHPIPPRTLVAPVHRHSREDEYSFVLEGRMGALLGEDVIYAQAGELAFKPRDQWHTFWNPDEAPCRILEIIAPGGFERFFEEFAALLGSPDFNPALMGELGARYGLEFEPESVPRLCAGCSVAFAGTTMPSTGPTTPCCTSRERRSPARLTPPRGHPAPHLVHAAKLRNCLVDATERARARRARAEQLRLQPLAHELACDRVDALCARARARAHDALQLAPSEHQPDAVIERPAARERPLTHRPEPHR
jgi:mannose-6-phosphate isomerase-like protein (cupin superfamily)